MPITIENLSFAYQPRTPWAREALNSVSLELAAGKMVVLCGETGSGKSTLLQLMNGLLLPHSGRVLVDGIDTATARRQELQLLRQRAGLLFQHPEQQIFEPVVFDEIAFGPGNLGMDHRETQARVEEALALVGLTPGEYMQRSTGSLSSGEKKRIALAGILALVPDYLLLDEPVAGLDARGKTMVREIIRDIRQKRDAAIIVTSHRLQDFLELADRVIVLQQGEIKLETSPQQIMENLDILRDAGLEPPVSMEILHALKERGWPLESDGVDREKSTQDIARVMKGE